MERRNSFKIVISKVLLIVYAFSVFTPLFHLGPFFIKIDYLIIPFLFLQLLIGRTRITLLFKNYLVIGTLLLISYLVADYIGSYINMGSIQTVLPTEFIQIFNRLVVFLYFYDLAQRMIIGKKTILGVFNTAFLLMLIIGFIQHFYILPFNTFFAKYYSTTETQGLFLLKWWNIRVYSVLGQTNKWAGLSAMLFFYFAFVPKSNVIKVVGLLLSLSNIMFTSTRAAILSLAVGIFILPLIMAKRKELSVILYKYLKYILIFIPFVVIAYFVFFTEINNIVLRFINLNQNLSDHSVGRIAQIDTYLKVIDGSFISYIIGLGKVVLDTRIGLLEVEPVYILAAYGIIGVFLHYFLVYLNIYYSNRLKKSEIQFYYFIVTATVSYLVFSLGYFFFREIIAATYYWALVGYFIGLYKIKANDSTNMQLL